MTALPEPDRGRVPELDGVRGLAILLVLVWHYGVCELGTLPLLFQPLALTWSGVTLFFVLSGYLIGGILLDHRHATNYFAAFYGRRVCRILPIYYVWLLLFTVAIIIVPRLPIGSAATAWILEPRFPIWSYATFTQNFFQARADTFGANWLSITWSLAVEEQFYLLLPVLIRFTPSRWLPFILSAGAVAGPVSRAFLYDPRAVNQTATMALLITNTDGLFLGVLCAWFIRRKDGAARIARWASALRVVFFSALGFEILDAYAADSLAKRLRSGFFLALTYTAFLLLAVHVPASPFSRIARWSWLRKLGIVAYGTYLVHEAVRGLVFGLALQRWPYVRQLRELGWNVVALAITLAVTAVSWRWFEKPIVRYGRRRWIYRDDGAAFSR